MSHVGNWEPRHLPWHDLGVENCEVCGRLLLARTWNFEDPERGVVRACGPDCETLWNEYLRERVAGS